MRNYYVYILASHSRCLYTGITNDLFVRVYQHKRGVVPGFTKTYRINRLVHFESTANVHAAIAREKQLKRWPRLRKNRLIEKNNGGWHDLSIDWYVDPIATAIPLITRVDPDSHSLRSLLRDDNLKTLSS
ncbi:MAG: GIY-YIG nuclease family protein [bacterium]